jgi:8-oxo-dGTP pyrophosphatase MutT (NUDIX family)
MSALPDDLLALQSPDLLGSYRANQVTRIAVGGVLYRRIEEDLAILVLKRVATDEYGGLEELPSGGVEPRETLGEALVREVWEETGLSIRAAGPFLFDFTYPSRRGVTVQLNFLVKVPGILSIHVSSAEHESFRWLPLTALANSGLSPEVRRGLCRTLTSTLLCQLRNRGLGRQYWYSWLSPRRHGVSDWVVVGRLAG